MSTCSECGSELPEGASYCPKCGYSLKGYGTSAPWARWAGMGMGARYAYKAEKRAFKEARHAGRCGLRASPEWGLFSAILWGLGIIFAGGLLYATSAGLSPLLTWPSIWAYLLMLLGGILVLQGLVAIVLSGSIFRMGGIIGGVVLLAIGAAWLSVTVAGWGSYLWAGIVVMGGVLVIVAAIGGYVFRTVVLHR